MRSRFSSLGTEEIRTPAEGRRLAAQCERDRFETRGHFVPVERHVHDVGLRHRLPGDCAHREILAQLDDFAVRHVVGGIRQEVPGVMSSR